MVEKIIEVKDYLTKSSLPDCDFVINPYVGCPNACRYCYACFMKRFTGHAEAWGEFLDVKKCRKPVSGSRLEGKKVFLSSVTDCYNRYEEKYQITQGILKQLLPITCSVTISTKSSLILRDTELLKQFADLKAAVSVNTLDEGFRSIMDQADSIKERLNTLKQLYDEGIYTVLFLSPIFPGLTDCKAIIEESSAYVKEYWFENLNLRGSYKKMILSYIDEYNPALTKLYRSIYYDGNKEYWIKLGKDLALYCKENEIIYKNYFYHEELVRNKYASDGVL